MRVVHASPGRLRLRVSREAFEDDALGRAERALTQLSGVRELRKNPLAGSILVSYDSRAVDVPGMLAVVERAGMSVVAPGQAPTGSVDRTALSELITTSFDRADRGLAKVSGGKTDLRTLVPVTLAALAIRQIATGGATAVPWYALLWYAFDSFTKLRRVDEPPTDPSTD